MDNSVKEYYLNKHKESDSLIHTLTIQSKYLSYLRLLLFIVGIYVIYMSWSTTGILILSIVLSVGLFSWLVRRTNSVDKKLLYHQNFKSEIEEELKIADHIYDHRSNGEKYKDKQNGFTFDLDVFGKGSLFQYINRSLSEQGQLALAASYQSPDLTKIGLNQAAIKELSANPDFIFHLRALQKSSPISIKSQSVLQKWMRVKSDIPSIFYLLQYILPLISLVSLLLVIFNFITSQQFVLWFIITLGIQGIIAAQAAKEFKHINAINAELQSLQPCLQEIEKKEFVSAVLNDLKHSLLSPVQSSKKISTLNALLQRYDYRMNFVIFIPLNFITWWDIHLLIALHKWKKESTGNIDKWYHALGQIEMLYSFGMLDYNHPQWCYPVITEQWHELKSTELGHPLIREQKLVTNDFDLRSPNHLALITGSNMAGKSTFLRSIGVNIVLANAGAPVCAETFQYTPGHLLTSMRISDNLQEETSTFYAELKKVNRMVQAIKKNEKVILLIDEMLRGTNAEDRKLGLHGFIHQILHTKAVAIIASHDISTFQFFKDYPGEVKAYYFDSIVINDEIHFDYKIKPGVVTGANASFLMKKMGIEI